MGEDISRGYWYSVKTGIVYEAQEIGSPHYVEIRRLHENTLEPFGVWRQIRRTSLGRLYVRKTELGR